MRFGHFLPYVRTHSNIPTYHVYAPTHPATMVIFSWQVSSFSLPLYWAHISLFPFCRYLLLAHYPSLPPTPCTCTHAFSLPAQDPLLPLSCILRFMGSGQKKTGVPHHGSDMNMVNPSFLPRAFFCCCCQTFLYMLLPLMPHPPWTCILHW